MSLDTQDAQAANPPDCGEAASPPPPPRGGLAASTDTARLWPECPECPECPRTLRTLRPPVPPTAAKPPVPHPAQGPGPGRAPCRVRKGRQSPQVGWGADREPEHPVDRKRGPWIGNCLAPRIGNQKRTLGSETRNDPVDQKLGPWIRNRRRGRAAAGPTHLNRRGRTAAGPTHLNRRGRAAAGPCRCGPTHTLNHIPLYAILEATQLRGRRTLNRRGRAAAGPTHLNRRGRAAAWPRKTLNHITFVRNPGSRAAVGPTHLGKDGEGRGWGRRRGAFVRVSGTSF